MIKIEETTPDILTVTPLGDPTLDDTGQMLEAIDRYLAKQAAFCVIYQIDVVAHEQTANHPEMANKTMKWLKQAKPQMTEFCRAMVVQVAPNQRQRKSILTMEQMGEKIYGCPVIITTSQEEALQTVRKALNGS
jgi:hypothetical protein